MWREAVDMCGRAGEKEAMRNAARSYRAGRLPGSRQVFDITNLVYYV